MPHKASTALATRPAATMVQVYRPLKMPAPMASSAGPYFWKVA